MGSIPEGVTRLGATFGVVGNKLIYTYEDGNNEFPYDYSYLLVDSPSRLHFSSVYTLTVTTFPPFILICISC